MPTTWPISGPRTGPPTTSAFGILRVDALAGRLKTPRAWALIKSAFGFLFSAFGFARRMIVVLRFTCGGRSPESLHQDESNILA